MKELYAWLRHRILFWLPVRPSQNQKACPQDCDDEGIVWVPFIFLNEFISGQYFGTGYSNKPDIFQDPSGTDTPISDWYDLLVQTAEWLVRKGLITKANCPVTVGRMRNRCLINTIPEHPDGSSSPQFKELSNGLFVESKWDVHGVALRCVELLTKFGQNPKQFQMGQYY